MRFLVHNALSPRIALGFRQRGHDAVHVRDVGLASAPDHVIFGRAVDEERIVVSADADFGTLAVLQEGSSPSVILLHRAALRRLEDQLELLLRALSELERELGSGCVAVLDGTRIRVRRLPLGQDD